MMAVSSPLELLKNTLNTVYAIDYFYSSWHLKTNKLIPLIYLRTRQPNRFQQQQTITATMNSTNPIEPYVIDGTNRIMQFVVTDTGKAWECAKNIEQWLVLTGNNATLELQTGTAGQVGVTYKKTETGITGGGQGMVHQYTLTETFTLRDIDDSSMKLTFDVLYGGTRGGFGTVENGMKQMILQIERNPLPQGNYLVKIITTGHPSGQDIQLPGIFACLSCCLLPQIDIEGQMKKMYIDKVMQLQHYFTVYQPQSNV